MPEAMLRAHGVSKTFGGVRAVADVDMEVKGVGVTALIGPNGAGKTTMFNILTGAVPATRGKVEFLGEEVTKLSVAMRARLGIARTFQTPQLFPSMTVRDNVLMGRSQALGRGYLSDLLGLPKRRASLRQQKAEAQGLLERFELQDVAEEHPHNLPYGYQRRVEIARALAADPRLLLLDEPLAGLNPTESARLGDLFIELGQSGMGVLLVEHDVATVMRVSDEVYVLDNGQLIAHGVPEAVQDDPAVRTAYLGRGFGQRKKKEVTNASA